MTAVLNVLNELNLPYELHEHEAVFTVEAAEKVWESIPGLHCKNLFLKSRKTSRYFLLVMPHDKRLSIKELENTLGNEKLSFASADDLLRLLHLTPGSVSPFGLMNDSEKQVILLLDESLKGAPRLGFHPNANTATVIVSYEAFMKFLEWSGQEVRWVGL